MKNKRFVSLTALLLAVCMLLCACGGAAEPTEPTEQEEPTNMFKNSMQKSDPSLDDEFNLLLIGNSGCYYYVEELHGIAAADGIFMRVCNLYYSGASVMQHHTWWKNGEAKCEFFVTDDNGRVKTENVDIMYSLRQRNWDAIGMCDGGYAKIRAAAPEDTFAERGPYLKDLYDLYRKEFPMTKLYWQAGAPYEVGYQKTFTISSYEDQQADNAVYRELAKIIGKECGVEVVPRGDAAQLARANPAAGDNLTARLGINGNLGDYYHDGDIGGGQYLTACVWYEVLTGNSCIGNTWRPPYDLSEERIEALQQAAHEAVANWQN